MPCFRVCKPDRPFFFSILKIYILEGFLPRSYFLLFVWGWLCVCVCEFETVEWRMNVETSSLNSIPLSSDYTLYTETQRSRGYTYTLGKSFHIKNRSAYFRPQLHVRLN